MSLELDKLTVARRQLATAIELLSTGGDTVSVYSLAANGWEVVDVLCRAANVESFSVQARQNTASQPLARHSCQTLGPIGNVCAARCWQRLTSAYCAIRANHNEPVACLKS